MWPRLLHLVLVVLAAVVSAAASAPAAHSQDLAAHIDSLSAFDHATRTTAARLLRRTPAAEAVPALVAAARGHADQFVRYRALVIVTSFDAGETPDLMGSLLGDRNDRVREVVYRWLERHPDPALRPTLLAALETEQADFVRPALVRAIASLPADDLVQRVLITEVGRGFDFFRGAVIEVLGQRRARYAVDAIAAVAAPDGPLQDDAVLALGRIGDPRALKVLGSIETPAPGVAPVIRAAECLLALPDAQGDPVRRQGSGDGCAAQIDRLAGEARKPDARSETVRAALSALTALAEDHPAARVALLQLAAAGTLRGEVAVALSAVALRRPADTPAWLAGLADEARTLGIELLREGFERLEEDFAEEQFVAAARATYWMADAGSTARHVTAALIDRLGF